MNILVVRAGDHRLGLDASRLSRVLSRSELDRETAVFQLTSLLGDETPLGTASDVVALIAAGDRDIGLALDGVLDFVSLSEGAVASLPAIISRNRCASILGATEMRGETLLIVDPLAVMKAYDAQIDSNKESRE